MVKRVAGQRIKKTHTCISKPTEKKTAKRFIYMARPIGVVLRLTTRWQIWKNGKGIFKISST